jgi:hypothetical protein
VEDLRRQGVPKDLLDEAVEADGPVGALDERVAAEHPDGLLDVAVICVRQRRRERASVTRLEEIFGDGIGGEEGAQLQKLGGRGRGLPDLVEGQAPGGRHRPGVVRRPMLGE